MFIFFDYLYIAIYKIFDRIYGKEPQFQAACFLSFLQTLNVLSLVFLYGFFVEKKEEPNASRLFVLIIIMSFIIFNYVRYILLKNNSHKNIAIRFNSKSVRARKRWSNFQLAYCVVSGMVFIIFFVYFINAR